VGPDAVGDEPLAPSPPILAKSHGQLIGPSGVSAWMASPRRIVNATLGLSKLFVIRLAQFLARCVCLEPVVRSEQSAEPGRSRNT
jgi:hypothetical protein